MDGGDVGETAIDVALVAGAHLYRTGERGWDVVFVEPHGSDALAVVDLGNTLDSLHVGSVMCHRRSGSWEVVTDPQQPPRRRVNVWANGIAELRVDVVEPGTASVQFVGGRSRRPLHGRSNGAGTRRSRRQ